MVKQYEVVILGSGISGTLLAAVLARNGVKVALIDSGTHPRFVIGESTVPETTTNLKIMAKLFDVPEIGEFANFFVHRDKVGASHGVKRGFSFCYHRPNQEHVPTETNQTATLSPPFGPDSHWFRQDTDQYMLTVASHYGADIYQQSTVTELSVREDEVELLLDKGAFKAEFVVDATGPFSPFAKQMGIRDEPSPLKTHSRGLFTHMVGVKSWDALFEQESHGMPYRMDQTTLHHLFDGGWMWVIPFDNHEQATNKLCSVGVMFDSQKHPKTDASPEQEFEEFLRRYPSIGRQFESARAVRKWVSSPRIQYSSNKLSVGRYFALPHAAAFIDPLFSTGLNLTAHGVNVLADCLIDSFKTGRLQEDRLRKLERQIIHKVEVFDQLVATSFDAFRSFKLWNAWYRIWEIGTYFNALGAMRCLMKYRQTGDKAVLRERLSSPWAEPLAYSVEGYSTLFERAKAAVERVVRGECTDAEGARAIYDELEAFKSMPYFITRREEHLRTLGTFMVLPLVRMFLWGRTRGPADTRRYYDFTATSFAAEMGSTFLSYLSRQTLLPFQPLWDMFSSDSSNQISRNLVRPPEASLRKLRTIAEDAAHSGMTMDMPSSREANGRAMVPAEMPSMVRAM
jgi:FADH2 O2-dependent halogenase